MPTTLNTQQVATISEFMQFVEKQPTVHWYRGCGDSSHTLVPSLYRHPKITDPNELLKLELETIKRFRQRSIPYLTGPLGNDDLDVLFLMQHFGVPTRLLDWTENPYIALFFALTSARYSPVGAGITYNNKAAIWVLEPAVWNSKAIPFDPPVGIVSPPNDDALNGYLPRKDTSHRPDPVAIFGSYNSPRIVAQRGAFCLFGKNVKPMETIYVDGLYPQDCLIKLEILADKILPLLESLVRIGITDTAAYPDLPGLAMEIKRHFGYRV